MTNNGWEKWQEKVLSEQTRLAASMLRVEENTTQMGKDLAALKVKSGIWGFAAGAIPVMMLILYQWLKA